MKIINESSGAETAAGEKGVLVFEPPLPPGCLTAVWRDDDRYVSSYFSHFSELLYSSLDWAIRDEEGYTRILGRTDDVINVAGHCLATREIEESVACYAAIAEAAVIGMRDEVKGQLPIVFAALKQNVADTPSVIARGVQQRVVDHLGALARSAHVYLVTALFKRRLGKLLRRSLQALVDQADPGDLSTLDDPAALGTIRAALARGPDV